MYIGNTLALLLIAVLFTLLFILTSFQIYTFYTFRYFIESSKVWKKQKYNSFRNKCLIFHIYIKILKCIVSKIFSRAVP